MAAEAQRYREFRMPDVGEGLTEAEILKWLVRPGDTVSDGQVVVEVETAKAAVELPIPYDGQVREILFEEGTTVDVGTPIITVDTEPGAAEPPGEPEADGAAPKERQPVLVGYGVSTQATKRRPRKPPAGQEPARPAGAKPPAPPAPPPPPARPEPAPLPGQAAETRPLAKPPVRKLAKDLGVDLAAVVPTGPGGIVTRDDVHAAAAPPAPPVSATAPVPAVEPQSLAAIRERRVPVKGVRKATAQAMVSSAFTAPHVTEFVTVDVTRTVRLVERLKQDPDMAGLRVNPLLLVMKALLVAIRRNPEVNAAWDEENQEIVYKDYVNLGIAAATPRGLIVPNIKDAGAKTLPELARALGELVTTAREGKTSLADMRDGTVTITNIGVFGIDTGTPILTPGESAILALGAIREQAWVHKGKIKPRHVTTLALSFDHRLVDGELGSRVLADVAAVLEHPQRLITWS
ncbi:dihydrolipoamide acetyltransferase family protein [Streptomyces litchfieldiae]|uniref:Dihydrolipoamide acetyltransferase component of pyruvate dehydrogenase complex n=1 Tax=Streptomyces litchfieldiae TaxID=3075543 RepID=A0ABU2MNL4_9ACTN|nr:dihydrolipoamide acetyltransferase family protein [Streptomyces sp. DSM 44938]MDT0342249.1 dihydrolipoamide acetyltransferase family protein [Streptomyces sp. DSM 44938]